MSEARNSARSLNLEFLRKQAKKRLKSLRANDAQVKLADVLLAIAREHGFASWRMLKTHVDAGGAQTATDALTLAVDAVAVDRFLDASVPRPDEDHRRGTLVLATQMLAQQPELAKANVYTAAAAGDHRRLQELLAADANQAQAPGGVRNWPPLCYLTFSRFLRHQKRKRSKDFLRSAKVLLDAGADPNSHFFATNNQGKQERETALYGACGVANDADLTKLLLQRGADPNNAPDGESLYHATEFDDHACLKLLLKKRIDRQWLSYCMGHMMDREDPAGLKLFLDAGADPNVIFHMGLFKGWRPLHFAINRHRSATILRMLLDAGADPNLADANGVKPYALARRLGHTEAADLLLRCGAKDELNEHQRILAAIMAGDEKLTRRLIAGHPDFAQSLSDEDRKLLPHAASVGNLKAVRLMLDAGFPIDTKGDWGGSAIHQAAWHGHLDVLDLLIERGANLHQRQDFGGDCLATAIHGAKNGHHNNGAMVVVKVARAAKPADAAPYLRFAEELGDPAVIDALRNSVQPGPGAGDDAASLMKAIAQRDLASVRAILKAHPEAVNQTAPHPTWGGTPQPLHVAIETGDRAIFDALIKAGADVNGDNEAYSNWSPLMLSVHWNRREMRDALLRRKARVGLIEALMLEDDKAVRRILKSQPNAISQPAPNRATPLHFARTPAAAQMLLDLGADPNAKDYYGHTAIQSIARRGPAAKAVIRLLKDRSTAIAPTALAAVGDLATLRHAVRRDPTIARDPAVLQAAVENGLFFVVRWLLERGADVNARTSGGSKGTMLHAAAWVGDIRTARLLVERGADVNALDEEHRTTPAQWARTALDRFKRHKCKAVAEYLEAVQQSRQPGSKTSAPKLRSSDWKPIMDSAFLGDAKRLKALLDAGADPNALSTTGHHYRPLHRAIEHKKTAPKHAGHEDVVRVLLAHGADPKLRATHGQVTALQLAAMQEPRFVPLLIDRFQPLDIFHACVCCDDKRVTELLKADKSLARSRDDKNWTPLHYCCASAVYKHEPSHQQAQLRIVTTLLDAGADVTATFNVEQWPIPPLYHCCGQHDNPAVAELLLKAGANACDNESVYHAADEGHEHCLALIERYTDKRQLAEECSKCLCTQMHWGRTRGAKWLLEHGADPNHLGRWGDSALHSAVKNSANDGVLKLLLAHGADVKLKNSQGQSALALAKSLGRTRILKILEERKSPSPRRAAPTIPGGGAMRYTDFRDRIQAALSRRPAGWTWSQLRDRLKLPYERPCPSWVARLEKEIGLARIKGPSREYVWKLEPTGRG